MSREASRVDLGGMNASRGTDGTNLDLELVLEAREGGHLVGVAEHGADPPGTNGGDRQGENHRREGEHRASPTVPPRRYANG